jgi:hypothetical protein
MGLPLRMGEHARTNSVVGFTIVGRIPLAPYGTPAFVVFTQTNAMQR